MSAIWNMKDYSEGLCTFADVDKPRQRPLDGPQSLPDEILDTEPSMAEFKQATLAWVRSKYGSYAAFLDHHPHFAEKFLLSMAKDATPPNRDNTIRDIPWLRNISPGRLSYKRDRLEVDEVQARAGSAEVNGVQVSWGANGDRIEGVEDAKMIEG